MASGAALANSGNSFKSQRVRSPSECTMRIQFGVQGCSKGTGGWPGLVHSTS